ncbi:MAG: type II restriction endonuclease [Deltaproteobacteria bacterium]|nr:type II restriction endonuclease [Deltaproteobacteria bacterium]
MIRKADRDREHLQTVEPLNKLYARERDMERVPVTLANGQALNLLPREHNALFKKIIDEFCPVFTPGGRIVYVGDTGEKRAYFDATILKGLGVAVAEHDNMPDVVVHHVEKNWLVLIEAVTSHGPVNPKRYQELKRLFAGSKAGLVFVTAFPDRHKMAKYLDDISWGTVVWVAESPTHLIHFNGERFLGPYEDEG